LGVITPAVFGMEALPAAMNAAAEAHNLECVVLNPGIH